MTVIEKLKNELNKVYAENGAAVAYSRNWSTIHGWKKKKMITYEEEKELLAWNRMRECEETWAGNN